MRLAKVVTLSLLLSSPSAFCIENGSSVDRAKAPSLVEMNCTGAVLGGKWVLTAAHCAWPSAGGLRPVNSFDNKNYKTVRQLDHPKYADDGIDVGLWELESSVNMDKVLYLSNLDDKSQVNVGDEVTFYGFGATGQSLNKAVQDVKSIDSYSITLLNKGMGTQIEGDSGGANLNKDGNVFAVTDSRNNDGGTSILLSSARDFILENVNAWHYPTTAKTQNGTVTIKVQSLHKDSISDTAYTDGDATITGGTCMGASVIKPFDSCTYEVSSNGAEGKLILGNNDTVTINKAEKPDPKPQPTPDNGNSSGGGSVGWLSLVLLALVRFRKA